MPEHPIVFSKVPESVTATNSSIEYDPSVSSAIDYEVELAVIIGKTGKAISIDDALDYVWGYTIVNDITARDIHCLLYTSPSPRDKRQSRMPSSA